MNPARRRFLWAFLAAVAILGAVWELCPLRDARARLNDLPKYGPGFTGRDIPLDGNEAHSFQGVSALKRLYQFRGHRFVLLVIDGSRNRHAVHDPVYCFRGAGRQTVKQQAIPIAGGEEKQLRLRKGQRETEAVCWFSDGSTRYSSALTYWCRTTMRRLTLGLAGEEPILVIMQPYGDRGVDWAGIMGGFEPLRSL